MHPPHRSSKHEKQIFRHRKYSQAITFHYTNQTQYTYYKYAHVIPTLHSMSEITLNQNNN